MNLILVLYLYPNDANYLLDGIKNYHEEIASLEGDIKALDDDRAPCFE
jgi:hypothetical protein